MTLSRTGVFLLTLWAVLTLNFLIPRLMPGDPALFLLGDAAETAPPAMLETLRARYGLDAPAWEQYTAYMSGLLRGDLGYSLARRQEVGAVLADKLPWTLLLGGVSFTAAAVLGVALGALSAWRGGRLEIVGVGVSVAVNAMPAFWVGMLLLATFAARPGGLPAFGAYTPWAGYDSAAAEALDVARHLILPATTLALALVGDIALLTHAAVRETMGETYVMAARGKGLRERDLLRRHVLRNAMLPLAARLGVVAGLMAGGSTLVETVFSYPGVGLTMYQAVIARDFPLLQGGFLVVALAVLAANAAAGLLYGRLDPRAKGGAA
ncbi:MAG: ABC transporter permease [Anaerolineae bacterium]|nr:ABC transporter permease [Anaerolineae bacterium]